MAELKLSIFIVTILVWTAEAKVIYQISAWVCLKLIICLIMLTGVVFSY